MDILEDVAEDNNHGHDGDRDDGDDDGDGEPANPVQPIWQSHHLTQLLYSSLLLLNNSLQNIIILILNISNVSI